MEERGGEGRSVSPGVFMSGWSVTGQCLVPCGPQDTNTQIAGLRPALRYLHLALHTLLSYLPSSHRLNKILTLNVNKLTVDPPHLRSSVF